MNEETSSICQNCYREPHIHLQKPYGEQVVVCEVRNGAIRIQDSLKCSEPDCVFCKCTE